jgi:hypothetical protein
MRLALPNALAWSYVVPRTTRAQGVGNADGPTIKKRFDQLKPGDVFQLSDRRTYILVIQTIPHGTMVLVNGYRYADPANSVDSFSSSYLANADVEVYSLAALEAPMVRLKEWGAVNGGGSYTIGGVASLGKS